MCPSVHGGVCLGPLEAGTYTTRALKTPLTYTVPDGRANYEDLLGNFLLVPPSGSLEGVDAGTSDYIGVYDGVAPASGDCRERPQENVALTPEAMAAWYAGHPGLAVEWPEPVTIGGLDGVVLDLAMAEGETGVCRFPDFDGRIVPVPIGAGPAELHHVLLETFTMRLYLLTAPTGEVIAIEIDDAPDGDTMESMTQVVEGMQFGSLAPAPGWHSSDSLTPNPQGETDAPLAYYEYLPPSYGDGDASPLLVFLHGLLESGDGSEAQLKRLLDDGGSIPYLINSDEWPADRPFVVLALQHPGPVNDDLYARCFEGPMPGDCALPIQTENGHPEDASICHRPAAVHEFVAYAVDTYARRPTTTCSPSTAASATTRGRRPTTSAPVTTCTRGCSASHGPEPIPVRRCCWVESGRRLNPEMCPTVTYAR